MTSDLPNRSSLLLVRNRAGVSVPFSVEVLATSLLVAGVEPPGAYAIASRLGESLHAEAAAEVESSVLAERAAELLDALVGPEAAERYRGWRRFRHLGRPLVLCLLGAPGVGKSTLATGLALRLGIHRVVPTEAVREVLRTVVPKSVLPELHVSAHDAVAIGPGSDGSGFLRQARAVSSAATAVAARTVAEGRNVLLVGAHLAPGETRAQLAERGCDAIVLEVLVTLEDERLHRARMLRRLRSDPAMPGARHLRNFRAVRSLQQQLRELARSGNVVSHDVASSERLSEWIVDHVVAEANLAAGTR